MEQFDKKNFSGREKPDPKFELKEIKTLEKPLINILDQMRDKIDKHSYDCILGDDTSGRVPTLILSRAIKNIFTEKRQEKIPAFFVAAGGSGGRIENYSNREEYIKRKNIYSSRLKAIEKCIKNNKEILGKQILMVTDFIESGETILNLAEILKNQNIKFDIAAISVSAAFNEKNLPGDSCLFKGGSKKWLDGLSVFFPVFSRPKIYGKPQLSGLTRSIFLREEDVFANPYNFSNKKDREKFLQARRESYLLADKLSEYYLKDEKCKK